MKIDKLNKKKSAKFQKVISCLVFIFPLLLCGCNTMEGVGTDIKKAGASLERSADEHKPDSRPCPCCYRHSAK